MLGFALAGEEWRRWDLMSLVIVPPCRRWKLQAAAGAFARHSILNLSRLPLCSRGVTHLRSLLGILNLLCVSDAKLAFLWATDALMFSKILSAEYARSPRMEI